MPYVRQKTVLPLAPRIRDLSVRESPWGMGQASCDPSDPACLNTLLTPSISTPSDILTPNISTLNPVQPTLTGWLQQNQTVILIGGGLLFGIALLKGLGRR